MKLVLMVVLLIIGFAALIKGADIFVDGSAGLAKAFRVPGVIIGLTIVAMGTSAPELAVSTSAALKGSNEIALSNVIGSNIFNILMVLGICALINPIPVDKDIIKRDFPICIGVTLLLLFGSCFDTIRSIFTGGVKGIDTEAQAGDVSQILAFIFLAIFVIYIIVLIISAGKEKSEEEEIKSLPVWKCLVFIAVGLALVVAGGEAVVRSAQYIARAAHMSETLIGLTIIALGTSLPELVTSIVASRKGENGLAVGNVVGSCIFNILLILGVSCAIQPLKVNMASLMDLFILTAICLLGYVFCRGKKIGFIHGLIFVLIYIADMAYAVIR